ncbi:MAG: tetratricopeptide repeat protein [Roseomonas sp.]|nr:tetratricopeptide repeat protein [Roseomonas sp.]MCA3343001.1 tetratricopeptide repeat protein [Roseomonas sp.]
MASPDLHASLRQHQAGNLDAAIAGYRALLQEQPNHVEANRLLGLALFARGEVAPAREAFERAASLAPPNAVLLNDLGNARRAMGEKAAAVEAFSAAIKAEPGFAFAHFNLADALLEAGDVQRASAAYEDIIARGFAGIDGDFHVNHGLCRLRLGDAAGAMEAFRAALTLEAGHSRAAATLSDTLQKLGQHREAVIFLTGFLDKQRASLETLISLGSGFLGLRDYPRALGLFERLAATKPPAPKALVGKGLALSGENRHEEAIAALDAAIALNPRDADALIGKGVALKALRRLPEAIETYRRTIEVAPRAANAHLNLGNALALLNRHEEALACYERVLALDPNSAEALNSEGNSLNALNRQTEAVGRFEKAVALDPGITEALSSLVYTKQRRWDWAGLPEQRQFLLERVRARQYVANPFALLGVCDDPELHQIAARAYTRETLPRPPIAEPAPATQLDRLRIGYFSADLHNHATMHLLAGVLECHDRDAFEIHAFSYGPEIEDTMRARARATVDHFHDCARLSDGAIIATARKAGIDIAVDLKGYTQDARLAPFAARLAPVQVSYLGYPGTVGADFLDYILADATVLPMDQQRFYDEKIIHLPDSYQANDDRRVIAPDTPSRAEAGLPADGFVYCCFNNAYKITPEIFASWMRIMAAVPGSVLWLLANDADSIARLRGAAEAQGVDATRLVFGASLPSARHLARHRIADLFLDTLPYNAHTTASDALWAGLPVLTQLGQAFAGRVAASLLKAVGLPEMITHDAAAYEALAIAIGRDPARAAALKAKLVAAIPTAPLFNTPRSTRHLEGAYRIMWQRHAAGLAPEGFVVPAEE